MLNTSDMYPKKVLIVDDDPFILNKLPQIFSKFYPKAEIDTAWSYETAMQKLKDGTYDIVLLDGEISQMRTDPPEQAFGYSLVKPIRESSSRSAKIIMISNKEDFAAMGISLGADLHIGKNNFFDEDVKHIINSLDLEFNVQAGV